MKGSRSTLVFSTGYFHLTITIITSYLTYVIDTKVMDSLQHVADLDPTRMGLVAYLLQEAEIQMKDNKDSGNQKEKVTLVDWPKYNKTSRSRIS